MTFDAEALQKGLAGKKIGVPFHYVPDCDSTNRLALELAGEGAPEGMVVLADFQRAGRGRLKRVWQSPPGCNLYTSILLRPPIDPTEAAGIMLMAGVAVAETVLAFCPDGVGLKWPNDVRIGGRKVCGILAETRLKGASLDAVVVGIGLNVNMVRADFDPAYGEGATSLREEAGKKLSRKQVALLLYEGLECWYETFLREGLAPVRRRWLSLSEMEGRFIRVVFRDEVREGRVAGLDDDGALLLDDGSGTLQRITAGDATIMKQRVDEEVENAAGH
jgi:BirA family biotin operon repressor/biotin-[acetyl-CoA-carboxylase] ligase